MSDKVTKKFPASADAKTDGESAQPKRQDASALRSIIENLPEATYAIDLDGRVIAWNKNAVMLTGVKSRQILGKSNYECSLPFFGTRRPMLSHLVLESPEAVKKNFPDITIDDDGLYQWVIEAITLPEEYRHLWGQAKTVVDAKGQIQGVVESLRVITEQRNTDMEIQATKDELEHKVENLERELEDCKEKLKESGRERERIENELNETNFKLVDWVYELEQRNKEIDIVSRMVDLLQACRTVEESYAVVARSTQELFPYDSGALCMYGSTKNILETVATWGDKAKVENLFESDQCWSLRRGKAHLVDDPKSGQICDHFTETPSTSYLCMPMSAQGEVLGMLTLFFGLIDPKTPEKDRKRMIEAKQRVATNVTEQFALSLGNLKLRQILHYQSVRDQLTGLFNRRYMEETLHRETLRIERENSSLGIIMIDVDHFKNFNDKYGHETGDTLLREMGRYLKKNVRGGDIACRYGGEEFILILPGADIEVSKRRAEEIRKGIKKEVKVTPAGHKPRQVTISLGVAVYPQHANTPEETTAAADAALYKSKQAGRDCVTVAPE